MTSDFDRSPLTEWELTAVAAKPVQRVDCDSYIARRLKTLAGWQDAAGVATWHSVALRVQAIREATKV